MHQPRGHGAPREVSELVHCAAGAQVPERPLENETDLFEGRRDERQAADHGADGLVEEIRKVQETGRIHGEHARARKPDCESLGKGRVRFDQDETMLRDAALDEDLREGAGAGPKLDDGFVERCEVGRNQIRQRAAGGGHGANARGIPQEGTQEQQRVAQCRYHEAYIKWSTTGSFLDEKSRSGMREMVFTSPRGRASRSIAIATFSLLDQLVPRPIPETLQSSRPNLRWRMSTILHLQSEPMIAEQIGAGMRPKARRWTRAPGPRPTEGQLCC